MKRLLLLAAVAGVAGISLFFFSNRSSSPPRVTTIRFWNGFTGPDGREMLKIVRQFNRENPDVRVHMQRMDWGTYYNKLFVAQMSHRSPEVFVVHASSLVRFARAGLLKPLEPLATGSDPLPIDDFDPNVWKVMHYEDTLMAVPLDIHPLGMFYNARLLKTAGFTNPNGEPRPPETRDEFLFAINKLKLRRPNGTQQWGFVFTSYRNIVLALIAQYGGKPMNDDGTRCFLDQPECIQALEFCANLVRQGFVPHPENFSAWIGFQQGKVALAFEGIYVVSDLQKHPEISPGGAPLPLLGKIPATWADSHGMCLRTDLEGSEKAAAWRFIHYLSDHSLQWAKAGQIPVRISLRNTPEFQAMTFQREFAKQIPDAVYSPRVPFIFEFYNEFDLAVERAMRGKLSASEALRIATQRINKAIERDREGNPNPQDLPEGKSGHL